MKPDQHEDQDVPNIFTEVHSSDRTGQTDRAVYRIDPRTSGMSFGLILDHTTELTELKLVLSDLLDNPRLIVEQDLAWVMKNPKTIVHSHFWAVWFIPTIVPSTLPPFWIRS
ncbi:hypothetical protein F2Q69_00013944 [Brassica cretica]|uniref:Uncharacterized protein n=1 Tax=Brassica cretica TaxID=69181 RepID=A0A8S9QZW7_BRACR|nr:hypothetical protein F2Q69_00013944 [Brassica cretica]